MSKLSLLIAHLIVFTDVANGYTTGPQVLTTTTPFTTLRITLSGSILPESTTSNHKVATESQLPSSVAQYLSTLSQFPIPDSSSQPSTAPYSSPLSQIAALGSPSSYTYFPSTISTASTRSIFSVLRPQTQLGSSPSNYVANPVSSFASVPGNLTYGAADSSSIDTSYVISSETSKSPSERPQAATTSRGVSTTQLLPSTPLELSSVQFFLQIEQEPSSVWVDYLPLSTSPLTTSENASSTSTPLTSPLYSSTSTLSFAVSTSSTNVPSTPIMTANNIFSTSLSSTIGSESLSISESQATLKRTENGVSFVFSSIQPLSTTTLGEAPSLSSSSVEVQHISTGLGNSSSITSEYFSTSQSIMVTSTHASFPTFLPLSSAYTAYTLPISAEIPTSFSQAESSLTSTLPFFFSEAMYSSRSSSPYSTLSTIYSSAAALSGSEALSLPATTALASSQGFSSSSTFVQTVPSTLGASLSSELSTITYLFSTRATPYLPYTSVSSVVAPFLSPTILFSNSIPSQRVSSSYLAAASQSSSFHLGSSLSSIVYSSHNEDVSSISTPTAFSEFESFSSGAASSTVVSVQTPYSEISTGYSTYSFVSSYSSSQPTSLSASTASFYAQESSSMLPSSSYRLSSYFPTLSSVENVISTLILPSSSEDLVSSSPLPSTTSSYGQESSSLPPFSSFIFSSQFSTAPSVESVIYTSVAPNLPSSTQYSETSIASYYESTESSLQPLSSYAFSLYLTDVSTGDIVVSTPIPSLLPSSGSYSAFPANSLGPPSVFSFAQESSSNVPSFYTLPISPLLSAYTSTEAIYSSSIRNLTSIGSSGFSTQTVLESQTTPSISSKLSFGSSVISRPASSQFLASSTSVLAVDTSVSLSSTYIFSPRSSEIPNLSPSSPSPSFGETFYSTSLSNTPSFARLATSTQVSVVVSSTVVTSDGVFSGSYSSQLPSSSSFSGTSSSTVLEVLSSSIEPSVVFPTSLGIQAYTYSTSESILSERPSQSQTSYSPASSSQSALSIQTAHSSAYGSPESSTETGFGTSSLEFFSIVSSTYSLSDPEYSSLEKTSLGESTSTSTGTLASSTGYSATFTTEFVNMGASSTVETLSMASLSSVIVSSSSLLEFAAMSSSIGGLTTILSSTIYQIFASPSDSVSYQLSVSAWPSTPYESAASLASQVSSESSAQTPLASQFSESFLQSTPAFIQSTTLGTQSSEYLVSSNSTQPPTFPLSFASYPTALNSHILIPVNTVSLEQSLSYAPTISTSSILENSFVTSSTAPLVSVGESNSFYASTQGAESSEIFSPPSSTFLEERSSLSAALLFQSSTFLQPEPAPSVSQQMSLSFTVTSSFTTSPEISSSLLQSTSVFSSPTSSGYNTAESVPTSSSQPIFQSVGYSSTEQIPASFFKSMAYASTELGPVSSSQSTATGLATVFSTQSTAVGGFSSLTSSPTTTRTGDGVGPEFNVTETPSINSSVPAPMATIAAAYVGYVDLGCFPDPTADGGPLGHGAALSHSFPGSPYSDSMGNCLAKCATLHSRYAGLEPGVCYCADSLLPATTAPGHCKLNPPLQRRGDTYIYIEIYENSAIPAVTLIYGNPSAENVFQTVYTGPSLIATSTQGFDTFTKSASESSMPIFPSSTYNSTATMVASSSALESYAELSYSSIFGVPSTVEVITTFTSTFEFLTISEATSSIVVVEPTYSENSGQNIQQGAISSTFESMLVGPVPTGIGTIDIGATETTSYEAAFTTETGTGTTEAIFATETASYVAVFTKGTGTAENIFATEAASYGAAYTTGTGTSEAMFTIETDSYKAKFASGTGTTEAAFTIGTRTVETIFVTETASYDAASMTESGTAEFALATVTTALEGGLTETATMSYISELVSAVPATITFEAYPTITSALQSIDSEGINTEVEPQNDLATSALKSAPIASTTASGASFAYPSHVSCQLAFPPESTPDAIGLATFAITPYNPNDQGTQYFGFGLNPEYGSQAITSESPITDDELLFYRVESSILPWDGYCDVGLGYYYHSVTGLCVTVAQTAQNYPKFQEGSYYLDFCDICNDGTPPLSQLFCLNSADCLTFSGDVPLARESFYGLNGYENLVGATVLNAGDCIMYTEGNLETGDF